MLFQGTEQDNWILRPEFLWLYTFTLVGGKFIMLLARPVTTITAYLTLEAGSMIAFVLSMFAQVDPNPLGFSRDGSMILAYASLLTAVFGGIVAVIQVVTTAKNAKVAHELELVKKDASHKEEMAQYRDKERQREIELIKKQNEAQRQEILRNNAWIQSVKQRHPAEEFGPEPDSNPEPDIVEKLATPIYPANLSPATPSLSGTEVAVETLPEGIVKQAAQVLGQATEVGKGAEAVMEAAGMIVTPKQ